MKITFEADFSKVNRIANYINWNRLSDKVMGMIAGMILLFFFELALAVSMNCAGWINI